VGPGKHDVVAEWCRDEEQKTGFTLPCAGIIRTGTKGVISPPGTADEPGGREDP
jgi:hypothetical protein